MKRSQSTREYRPTRNWKGAFCFLCLCVLWIPSCLAADPTTTPKAAISWSIDPPVSPWNITDHNWTEFEVTISGNAKIESLNVAHSTLVDSDTGRGRTLSADQFHLCPSPTKTTTGCEDDLKKKLAGLQRPPDNAAGPAQPQPIRLTLWLVVDDDAVPNGTFTGNLYLDTKPFTETKTLQLTINRSTRTEKYRGLLAIFAGVVLAWLVTVLARSRLSRDQALLPVEVLRQKLEDIQAQMGAVPQSLKVCISETLQKISTVLNDLSTSSLDEHQLLPPTLPALTPSATQATIFQTFITTEAQIVDNLNVIATGIQEAATLAATIPPARLPALQGLVRNVNQFATTLPTQSSNLQVQIKQLFDNWNATPQAQEIGEGGRTQLLALAAPAPVGIYRIRMEIQTITLLFWAVWGALSILIGFTLLVMPSPGFGTTADYIRCVLWGFGLPVTGQGLQTLTMSSLNTQLGVTLPK